MEEVRFERFAALIARVHGNIRKLKTRYAAQLGLKPVHIFWLYLLCVYDGGMSASELAVAGKSDRSLVSRELDYLLDRGIVQTLGAGERRRYGWKLQLTEKGQKIADAISVIVQDIQNKVSGDIPQSDLTVFYRTLHRLADGLEQVAKSDSAQEETI